MFGSCSPRCGVDVLDDDPWYDYLGRELTLTHGINVQGLPQLLPDIARLLGARLLVPLTVGLNLLALLVASTSGADGVVGGGNSTIRVALSSLVPLTAALIALLAPVPPQVCASAPPYRYCRV